MKKKDQSEWLILPKGGIFGQSRGRDEHGKKMVPYWLEKRQHSSGFQWKQKNG